MAVSSTTVRAMQGIVGDTRCKAPGVLDWSKATGSEVAKPELVKGLANSGAGTNWNDQGQNARPATASLNVSPDAIFLTTKELAARHRRNPKTLRNGRVKGTYLPFHDVGGIRYRLSDVMAYEQTCRVPCGSRPRLPSIHATKRFSRQASLRAVISAIAIGGAPTQIAKSKTASLSIPTKRTRFS
jgi:hypothetical protein